MFAHRFVLTHEFEIRKSSVEMERNMTLSECYEEMGADLQEVLRRLKTEERIGKFLKLILTDTNYESLCKALEEKNYEQAFTHIHNLKGLAMNLGLTPLLVPAQELCEELRDGEPERELKPLLDEVAAAYQKVLGIVERLD